MQWPTVDEQEEDEKNKWKHWSCMVRYASFSETGGEKVDGDKFLGVGMQVKGIRR